MVETMEESARSTIATRADDSRAQDIELETESHQQYMHDTSWKAALGRLEDTSHQTCMKCFAKSKQM